MHIDRRHFLATTGASIGGALLTSVTDGFAFEHNPATGGTMPFPDEAMARTERSDFKLDTVDQRSWKKETVDVRLKRIGSSLAIIVRSTEEPLASITLVWKRAAPAAALYLGDAWERAYGDLGWRKLDPKRIMPWYMVEYDGSSTHAFGVKTGCRSMCYWQVDSATLKLVLDTRSGGRGVQLGRRALEAARIVTRNGKSGESAFQAVREFCARMCDKPRLPREPMAGMLDWYFAYGNSTAKLFLEEAALFAKLVDGCGVKAFALVDSGWAPRDSRPQDVGWHDDQTQTRPYFGSMPDVAAKVRAMGLVPGVWIRPLCAHPNDPEEVRLARERIFLDPSLPANLERIRKLARLMRQWGFGVIKHDYTTYDIFGRWGFDMGTTLTSGNWTFKDRSKTTAEIMLALYQALRDGCGGDGLIIGCNTVSHLSAGLFEYCRVGDDCGNNLERAMKFGPNPFAFRLPQHRAFYAADPDCIGNLKEIPWKYNRQFLRLVSESGALIQLSTRLGNISDTQRQAFRDAFTRVGRKTKTIVEPLDWMERSIPARWKIGDTVVDMDWDLTRE